MHGADIETKLSLLLRTVFCIVNWKFSRWPFCKSIAVEMDNLQTNMVSILSRVPKNDSEDWVGWLRRKRRLARDVCDRIGLWSEAWAKRLIDWDEHLHRDRGVLNKLLLYHNSDWLQAQRSQFVPAWGSVSTRNSVLAGRTGTRANGGRPQQRWDAGICLAQAFLRSRRGSLANSHALSVSSRIRNAIREIYEFFNFADLEPG